jgi:hypothetical protein
VSISKVNLKGLIGQDGQSQSKDWTGRSILKEGLDRSILKEGLDKSVNLKGLEGQIPDQRVNPKGLDSRRVNE